MRIYKGTNTAQLMAKPLRSRLRKVRRELIDWMGKELQKKDGVIYVGKTPVTDFEKSAEAMVKGQRALFGWGTFLYAGKAIGPLVDPF